MEVRTSHFWLFGHKSKSLTDRSSLAKEAEVISKNRGVISFEI